MPFPSSSASHPKPFANPVPKHSSLGSPQTSRIFHPEPTFSIFQAPELQEITCLSHCLEMPARCLRPFISCTKGICAQEKSSEEARSAHRFFEAVVWFWLFIFALVQSHLPSDRKGSDSACHHAAGFFQAKETLSLSPSPRPVTSPIPSPFLSLSLPRFFSTRSLESQICRGRTMSSAKGGILGSPFIKNKAIEMTH